jgi:adenylate kinase
MGQEAKSCMAQARMVPDEVVLGIIGERMDDPDVRGGCILDGFPRTIPQANGLAELLEQRDLRLDAAIALDVPVELLPDRAIGRRMDKKTGRIYHLKYNPPPPGAELVHRADDQVETVAQRIAEYDALTAGLLPYYGHRGLLSRVDGTGTLQEVTERVRSVLGV